jgi:hypothetical protein
MKRLLFCLVALIAVFALVMPTSAAEVKISGIYNAKAYARDNFDGYDDNDDSTQFVTQRMRMYFNIIASENLKLVYKNEIDMEWGDSAGSAASRNSGGGAGGDAVNLETKNVYLEFMVPDTPVKATLGLQGVALHKGWFLDDDLAGARFDMNFDPVSITTYWMGLAGLEADDQTASGVNSTDASNDNWQLGVSGAYKAENMDARLSVAYERRPNDTDRNPSTPENPESDDLYMVMGEFGMGFDMVSFNVLAAKNFGELKSDANFQDRNYDGYMFKGDVAIALDMATIRLMGLYASGDKEDGDAATGTAFRQDDDFQVLTGQTAVTAEIISDGYSYDRNANLTQIGGANHPSNMWMLNAGVDLKPTDTTTLKFDVYYVGMVEKRTIGGDEEDEIGIEIDARLTQKIYDNLSLTLLGCYLFAEDGYGRYDADAGTDGIQPGDAGSGDDAFQVGLGLDFKF